MQPVGKVCAWFLRCFKQNWFHFKCPFNYYVLIKIIIRYRALMYVRFYIILTFYKYLYEITAVKLTAINSLTH